MNIAARWQTSDPRDLIARWVTDARWFDKTSGQPEVHLRECSVLRDDDDFAVILQLASLDDRLYSLPLYVRDGHAPSSDTDAGTGTGVLGEIVDSDGDSMTVYDATEIPDGQFAILETVLGETQLPQGDLALTRAQLHGSLKQLPEVTSSHKLRSEQSNTSLIYHFEEPDTQGSVGLILKIFRALAPGNNPDVELMAGLDQGGSSVVPHQYGSLSSTIAGDHVDLLVVQEFLDGATDAWQVMTSAIARSAEFAEAEPIRDLGITTRKIHDDLARSFEVRQATNDDRTRLRQSWQDRAERALQDAPELEEYRDTIAAVFDTAMAGPWPNLQRVHGDYHLGQVLLSPERGWYALDFEGEPLRPLKERTEVDLALRDVAGMLRSFDYVAGAASLEEGEKPELVEWSQSATRAFLEGYGDLETDERDLLSALILDKALYEVSYETASRPTWRDIPLRGVREILANYHF